MKIKLKKWKPNKLWKRDDIWNLLKLSWIKQPLRRAVPPEQVRQRTARVLSPSLLRMGRRMGNCLKQESCNRISQTHISSHSSNHPTIHSPIQTYTHTYPYLSIQIQMCTHTYPHPSSQYKCVHTNIHIHPPKYKCVCIHIHIHPQIHTLRYDTHMLTYTHRQVYFRLN